MNPGTDFVFRDRLDNGLRILAERPMTIYPR